MRVGQWLALAVLAVSLAVVAAHPRTGWLVRVHGAVLAGSPPPGFSPFGPEAKSPVAARPVPDPGDAELSFGRALQAFRDHGSITLVDGQMGFDPGESSVRLEPLADVVRAFPRYAPARAAFLRLATQGAVRIGRDDELRRAEGKEPLRGSSVKPRPAPRPEALRLFDRMAADGERFDPDNAYFPAMRAIGHLAAGDDDKAWDDLRRAGAKPAWREYVPEEADAGDRLAAHRGRGKGFGAIGRIARGSAILFPQYASLRSVSRLALGEAMRRETTGDAAGGIALRFAVIGMGRRMRTDGTTLICNLVGIAMVAIVESRPGGAVPPKSTKKDLTEAERLAAEDRRNAEFTAWLAKHGGTPEQVRSVRDDLSTAREIKRLAQRGVENGVFDMRKMGITVLAMLSGVLVLGNLIQMLVLRCVAEAASRATAIARGGRLAPGTFLGGLVGVLVLQLPAGILVGRSLGVAASSMRTFTSGEPSDTDLAAMIAGVAIGALATAVVPALSISALLVRAALVRKTSFSRTVVLGLRGVAIPIAALLGIGYAAATVWGASRDAALDRQWQATFAHEGRQMARLARERWPGDR